MQEEGKENRVSGRVGEKGGPGPCLLNIEIDRHHSRDPDYRFEIF